MLPILRESQQQQRMQFQHLHFRRGPGTAVAILVPIIIVGVLVLVASMSRVTSDGEGAVRLRAAVGQYRHRRPTTLELDGEIYHEGRTHNASRTASLDALCARVLGSPAVCSARVRFVHEENVAQNNETERDAVSASCDGKTLTVRASTTVAAAFGFHQALKHHFHSSIMWGVGQTGKNIHTILKSLSAPWPVFKMERRRAVVSLRYMYNVCTFSYTMSWWKWPEWESELDWLALHGINTPLALVGQEYIWLKLWREVGLTDAEVAEYFTGPAFLAWHWMGNLRRWAGPLPEVSWTNERMYLQKKILRRMRELGMRPVLPAFAGHVPQAAQRVFPQSSFRTSKLWMGFNSTYSGNLLMDPSDEMFPKIGQRFLDIYFDVYGAPFGHYYSADTFNEMVPHTPDDTYLSRASAAVLEGIRGADPDGVWVLQGWLFLHHSHFWTPQSVRSYLEGVPRDRVVVLDLAAEKMPMYKHRQNFHGAPFVWGVLHNFGAKRGLHGDLLRLVKDMRSVARQCVPGSVPECNLAGFGLTMEATHQNPVVYELASDMMWEQRRVSGKLLAVDPRAFLDEWLGMYTHARYGIVNNNIVSAFHSWSRDGNVYTVSSTCCPAWGSADVRPGPFHETSHEWYDKSAFMAAAHTFLMPMISKSSPSRFTTVTTPLRYDAVDVARQVLDLAFMELQQLSDGDDPTITTHAYQHMLQLLATMDAVLQCDPNFRLSSWLDSAASWAATPEELSLYIFNAKNLISLWGDGEQGADDYSSRSLSGLYTGYYQRRWQHYTSLMVGTRHAEHPLASFANIRAFRAREVEIGQAWARDTRDVAAVGRRRGEDDLSGHGSVTVCPALVSAMRAIMSTLEENNFVVKEVGINGTNAIAAQVVHRSKIRYAPFLAWACEHAYRCDGFYIDAGVGNPRRRGGFLFILVDGEGSIGISKGTMYWLRKSINTKKELK
eukprot:PhM_4_TR3176/c0_g1_i1/m.74935/K01205/NAGLU; alpha-N-acetylglucosaminidase